MVKRKRIEIPRSINTDYVLLFVRRQLHTLTDKQLLAMQDGTFEAFERVKWSRVMGRTKKI